MPSLTRACRRAALAFSAPCLLFAAACGSELADDPLFNDQQAAVLRVDDDLKAVRTQVEDLNRVVSNLVTEVETLKGSPLTGTEGSQRLDQRVEVLESAVRQSNQTLSEMRELLDMKAVAAPAVAVSGSAANGGSTTRPAPTATPATSKVRTVTVPRPTQTSRPKPASTPKPAAGFYYTVRSGDTLSQIASRNGVSAERLRQENHIPTGREPYPGQQIYISK